MDPEKALSLLERAGALGVLGLMFFLAFKGKIVFGWIHDKVQQERDDYRKRFLDKVDPPSPPHPPA